MTLQDALTGCPSEDNSHNLFGLCGLNTEDLEVPIDAVDDLFKISLNRKSQQVTVKIPNSYEENLVGILHETHSKEIVVLCYGFSFKKDDEPVKSLAAGLANRGMSVFLFDFSGTGDSEGYFPKGNFVKEAEDINAVVKHFNGAKRVVGAVVGHGRGADAALIYASKYHEVAAIVNVSGCFDLQRGIPERLGKDIMESLTRSGFIANKRGPIDRRLYSRGSVVESFNTIMQNVCQLIASDCRVLTVHGSADEVFPVADASEFAQIIPNHKLHIVLGADHCYTYHLKELIIVVANFIGRVLHSTG